MDLVDYQRAACLQPRAIDATQDSDSGQLKQVHFGPAEACSVRAAAGLSTNMVRDSATAYGRGLTGMKNVSPW